MDFLDSNLHQSILGALAANLASSSTQDDLSLLTESFSSLEPVTNGVVNGVLARLGAPTTDEPAADPITVQQVESIIAFSEYATNAEPSPAHHGRLLQLLRDAPTWDVEPALGLQASQDWAPPDRLSHALISSVLVLTEAGAGDRSSSLTAVAGYQKALVEEIERSEGHRIIGYLLPALNGARRAINESSFTWNVSDATLSGATPAEAQLTAVAEAISRDWDLSTEGGRLALATLRQYETSSKSLSAGLVVLCDLEAQRAYWASSLTHADACSDGWKTPLASEVAKLQGGEAAQAATSRALEAWSQTLLALQKLDSEGAADPYSLDILLASLKLATVSTIASGANNPQLGATLEALLTHPASVSDEALQIGAVECLQAITHAFPGSVSQASSTLRRFILSPSPIFEQIGELGPSPAMLAATKAYASLIELSGAKDLRVSAVQSLLNHFSLGDRESVARPVKKEADANSVHDTIAGAQKGAVSANIAHAVARLALEFNDEQTSRLVASMLLQRLAGTDPAVDGAVMFELTELAYVVDKSTFADIVKSIYDVSKSLGQDSFMTSVVLTAQTRLATAAASRPAFHTEFLTETLALFLHKGVAETGRKTSRNARTDSLLELIPVIDTFLTAAKFNPRGEVSPALVALFRGTWYLCLLSGFLSTPARIAEWQRAALVRIASHTPGLLRGVSNDFVETELEFSTILRSQTHALSPDSVRAEFASSLPQQATNARGLPVQQVIFLATVLGLESLRAEAGQPSTILTYFHVEGVNNHAQVYETLVSIAEKVNATFIHRLTELVTTHSMDSSIYREVREVLLETSHQFAKVRTVATRYANDLFANFPSLLCAEEVVTVLLEMLTVLRRACLAEFVDEYTPTFSFHSGRSDFSIVLPDDYSIRNKVLSDLHRYARAWLKAGLNRAPLEMRGLLQSYIDGPTDEFHSSAFGDDEMGKSVAVDLVRMSPSNGKGASLPNWGDWKGDDSANFARTFAAKGHYGGSAAHSDTARAELLEELDKLAEQSEKHQLKLKLAGLRQLLYRAAGYLVKAETPDVDVLHQVVALPVRIFTESAIALAQDVWTWIVDARPELESRLMAEIAEAWSSTVLDRRGLFSSAHNREDPLNQETQYSPTDKEGMIKEYHVATRLLQPHSTLLSFLSSRFQSFRYRDSDLVYSCLRIILNSSLVAESWSTHQLARELRMRLLAFGFCVLQGSQLESSIEFNLRASLYNAALSWFAIPPGWTYGSNRIQLKADLQAVEELQAAIKSDSPSYGYIASSGSSLRSLPGRFSVSSAVALHNNRTHLLLTLLENEADRIKLWINPMMDAKRGPVPSRSVVSEATWRQLVRIAWSSWPDVAIQLPERAKHAAATAEVTRLVRSHPLRVQANADALKYFIGESIAPETRSQLRHLLFWAPVPVISALRFLFGKFGGDPILLQYALRVLEHHPVGVTFFYIPQVVQALRTDALGYAERFIFETSQISQLFCHQIIWNMKANAYRGDAGEEEDPMKPTLDRMVKMIVGALSGEAKAFFQREFAFFDEVTSISAKLKPFIKSPKPEKKAKIDEEMAKIKVDPGVYLPSNPDGVLVDIDRKSGRPLQSHAKAPFMATFKVRRDRKTGGEVILDSQDAILDSEDVAGESKTFDTWQAAIFKVGDDCRQDVLALQIIAMHKNIFTSLGLDLLVTPYRVTATGPGCGVIDVVPNATSRDEMGRAKINDLKSFFVIKYGSPEGIEFQRARTNFIQSMAAYSLLCYIVQIKDRHNGNIMIDGRGCITHIDFGFLFDIGPGGVKFEPSSFKLTHEMVVLMGGRDSPGFRQFTELTVKSFLACRPYGQAVVETSALMAGAGFPSYKDDLTMHRLAERFRLDLSEVDAAEYMKSVINNALENPRSIIYDQFQLSTNGIPYVR
ncbi:hypothetical protein BCR35DRAFT_304996 [Leucosporidium creatinivorum]|uniref:1-phosphatidylinositol 4-kinase n=1 Tax=Leucosporidium creatinivorum TaxID=106004 RepID=A0A1Y2F4X6_9BASI|nr:hypothetical protein BCR35DRAFT_304996 [Leucosporidium creatinivorum]